MHLRHVQPNVTRVGRLLDAVRAAGVTDERVLEAMGRVPREVFLSPGLAVQAYDDKCLPIGGQQTISMPSVVGVMTQALELKGTEKVLEIGTGCGYQCAILSKLARRVFTIERLKVLSDVTLPKLAAMGCTNVAGLVGDGTLGWPQQAPFDAIMVTAAGPKVPLPLVEQLAVGGRLVIPVGPDGSTQQKLVRVRKGLDGSVAEEVLGLVAFVPLVGKEGY